MKKRDFCFVLIMIILSLSGCGGDTYNITGDNNSVGNTKTVNGVNVEVPVDVGVDTNKTDIEQNTNTDENNSNSSEMDKSTDNSDENDIESNTEDYDTSKSDTNDENNAPKEKITVSETHTPNDVVWGVSIDDWDVNNDYGIDGNRYGGGIKVELSNMFTSMGDGGTKELTSRIMIPLSEENKDPEGTVFTGIFVLDQSMYGSHSYGTISIIANNEVLDSVYMDGSNTESHSFNVNCGDADSIIIETKATLKGSSFIFGMVSPKE